MKKLALLATSVAMVAAMALAVLFTACGEIENDGKAKVSLSLNLPAAGPRSAEDGGFRRAAPAGVSPAGFIEPSTKDRYFVRVTLTNPSEEFIINDFQPPAPVTLNVASGSGRVLDVEVYYLPGGMPSANYFPAERHIIDTFASPATSRTLDLQGEAVSVQIYMIWDGNLGSVYGGSLAGVQNGGSVIPLPYGFDCPPVADYYANITDSQWGLNFPSVPVTVSGGTPPTLAIYNFPMQKQYNVHLFHYSAGFYTDFPVTIPGGSYTTVDPGSLLFQGFNSKPSLTFDPSSFNGVPPDSWLFAYYFFRGGMGNNLASWFAGTNDTCAGMMSSPNLYEFYSPMGPSCFIHVEAYDCAGYYAQGQIKVTTPCGNNICEPGKGEDSYNCPSDCGGGW